MLFLTLSLPLVGGLANLFSTKTGTKGATVLSCIAMIVAFGCLLFICYEVVLMGSPVTLSTPGSWYAMSSGRVEWAITVDAVTCMMLVAVYTVSGLVHLYSLWYMDGDPHNSRFFMLISLFTFFMALLVIGSTLPILFIGWEGIGVVSYLLISF